MYLAFEDMHGQFQAYIGPYAASFKLFRCSNDFITKRCISRGLMRAFVVLIINNVSCVGVNPGFFASHWSTGFYQISSGISPLAGGLCKSYPNARGKRPIQRQPLIVQYKHQANPHLSTNNYTTLVINRNVIYKQLTLISLRKLALTAKINFCFIKSSEHIKNFNTRRVPYFGGLMQFCNFF